MFFTLSLYDFTYLSLPITCDTVSREKMHTTYEFFSILNDKKIIQGHEK